MAATALLLAGGTYLIGWRMVRRITRLNSQIDQTLAEGVTSARPGGDELQRLEQAFADLRERLARSRERLAAQQRLATTGKLASMVAHEVRNPLQALRLTVEMLRGKLPGDQREACDVLLGEIDRLNRLTEELLILAGKDARRVEAVDLGRELADVLRLLRLQLRQRELVSETALPALPAVEMDRNRCRQLLLNILLNAVEASPRGGAIAISARVEAQQVRLSVADQGKGFPDAVLTGQAEELFSTKSTGAGLGLSICRRIVEEARGALTLYNAASGGAVAEISLPAQPPAGQAGASTPT
jgi:signal transduction histidine kinase